MSRGGQLLIFGVTSGDAEISLSPFRIYNDEITVLGSMAVLDSFGAAADLMVGGVIDTGPLLGDPFPLAQFPDALASVRAGEGIRIQVRPASDARAPAVAVWPASAWPGTGPILAGRRDRRLPGRHPGPSGARAKHER